MREALEQWVELAEQGVLPTAENDVGSLSVNAALDVTRDVLDGNTNDGNSPLWIEMDFGRVRCDQSQADEIRSLFLASGVRHGLLFAIARWAKEEALDKPHLMTPLFDIANAIRNIAERPTPEGVSNSVESGSEKEELLSHLESSEGIATPKEATQDPSKSNKIEGSE